MGVQNTNTDHEHLRLHPNLFLGELDFSLGTARITIFAGARTGECHEAPPARPNNQL